MTQGQLVLFCAVVAIAVTCTGILILMIIETWDKVRKISEKLSRMTDLKGRSKGKNNGGRDNHGTLETPV